MIFCVIGRNKGFWKFFFAWLGKLETKHDYQVAYRLICVPTKLVCCGFHPNYERRKYLRWQNGTKRCVFFETTFLFKIWFKYKSLKIEFYNRYVCNFLKKIKIVFIPHVDEMKIRGYYILVHVFVSLSIYLGIRPTRCIRMQSVKNLTMNSIDDLHVYFNK